MISGQRTDLNEIPRIIVPLVLPFLCGATRGTLPLLSEKMKEEAKSELGREHVESLWGG